MRGARALSAIGALAALPAMACAVCGAGDEPSRGSYVLMSVIISLLPVAMLGGIAGFVFYRSRQMNAQNASESRR